MDFKRIRWVPGLLSDLGLHDTGDGRFWTSRDRSRSVYLGDASMVVFTVVSDKRDFETVHRYPSRLDEGWLLSAVADHAEQLEEELRREDDQSLN